MTKKIFGLFAMLIGCLQNIGAVTEADFTFYIVEGKVTITKYNGTDVEVEIPSTISGYPVVQIGDGAFSHKAVERVVIPNSVEIIYKDAFAGCEMANVTIGSGVTSIHPFAFRWNQLERFEVSPANTAYASVDGVLYTKNLTEIVSYPSKRNASSYSILNTVTTIDDYAFFGCEVETIEVPASVTDMGTAGYIFHSPSIKEIIVSEDNTKFASENGALFNKEKTELLCYLMGMEGEYQVPASVKVIKEYAFDVVEGLTSIVFPEGITTFELGAFYQCTGLKTITLPSTVTYIGNSAFYCSNLEKITMKGTVPPEIGIQPFLYTTCPIYVPQSAVADYTAAWTDLADRIVGVATGIPEHKALPSFFDIYDLQGRKVRSKVSTIEGQPKGIYIINGKKVIKK